MSKGNVTETDLLNYVFKATAFPWNAETNLKIHLHTDDPGEAGISTLYEATYTSYNAVVVARTAGGWTVSGNTASNAALIQFPQCAGGSNVVTHVSISPETTTQILYSGQLNSPLTVTNLIQPQFAIGALTITED
jgi:hypothetical protein